MIEQKIHHVKHMAFKLSKLIFTQIIDILNVYNGTIHKRSICSEIKIINFKLTHKIRK